jgi:hypothetical protein
LDHLDHLDRASNGAGSSGPGIVPSPGPHGPNGHSWTNLDAWCARLGALPTAAERRVVLCEWVAAAGGWSDAVAVHLPTRLPRCLALATLKAHARALRLDVREDPDGPEPFTCSAPTEPDEIDL